MPGSIFTDKNILPDSTILEKTLNKSFFLFEDLKCFLEENYGNITEEWKFYNIKSGWLLKMLLKKRNLFFINVQNGFFRISFVFGDKAVLSIEKSDLPTELIQEIVNAKKYVEGRGISLDVISEKELDYVKHLVHIKVKN